jgi:predicted nuclease of predicted toxin-antitoxin system
LKIVADESVDRQIVERLRLDGYEVVYIAELDPGIDDETVLDHSRRAKAILLTADKDFGELVFRQHLVHSGVLLSDSRVSSQTSRPNWLQRFSSSTQASSAPGLQFFRAARFGCVSITKSRANEFA